MPPVGRKGEMEGGKLKIVQYKRLSEIQSESPNLYYSLINLETEFFHTSETGVPKLFYNHLKKGKMIYGSVTK